MKLIILTPFSLVLVSKKALILDLTFCLHPYNNYGQLPCYVLGNLFLLIDPFYRMKHFFHLPFSQWMESIDDGVHTCYLPFIIGD